MLALSHLQDRFIGEGNIRVLPGQYFDAEMGTNYNYYRDYEPKIGGCEQSDPTGLGCRYQYLVLRWQRASSILRSEGIGTSTQFYEVLFGTACARKAKVEAKEGVRKYTRQHYPRD
jgi:hypothetical protein